MNMGLFKVVIVLAIVAVVLFPYIASLIWIARDAKFRGKPGLPVALLAGLLYWPLSLLLWIVLRPDPMTLRESSTHRDRS